MERKICTSCGRNLPSNIDYYFMRLGKLNNRCKECCGRHFTNNLTHIPKEGFQFCKKCDRELPYTFQYFPEDKSTKTGLRNVCRECNPSYGRFLKDGEEPNRAWSQEEIDLLKSVYNYYTGLEIIDHNFFPGRTLRAIECEAGVLGIAFKTEETKQRAYKHQAELVSEMMKGRDLGQEWRDKISATKKEYYKTHHGTRLGHKNSKETRRKISEARIAAGKWKGKDNPRYKNPLNGELNGRWQGGITDTYRELRSDTKDWQNESMEYCKYKCVITGGEFDNIHHTEPFKDIVEKVFEITKIEKKVSVLDYEDNDFELLRYALKELHKLYGFGACLCKEVHKLFHDLYGYTKFNGFDFLDFIYRIDSGEFDQWFEENKLKINVNYDYVEYLEYILLDLEESVAS
jgi:hypothetical protein